MNKCPASIFNDVIGPVMRGPSSSHVAAASRIGQLVAMANKSQIIKVVCDFDINGSLCESYHGHGSDIGLVSGILNIPLTDKRVTNALQIAQECGVKIEFNMLDYGAVHPNNYRLHIYDYDGNVYNWEAVSVGGGMIELTKFNSFDISICGDYYELLVIYENDIDEKIIDNIKNKLSPYEYLFHNKGNEYSLINVKTKYKPDDLVISYIRSLDNVKDTVVLTPVLPTKSRANCQVPFSTAQELLDYAKDKNLKMWELASLYESVRGEMTQAEVLDKMYEIVKIMQNAVKEGLAGTEYEDRILGPQAYKIDESMKNGSLIPVNLLNNIIKDITAIMEVKSSMGVIVASPTAGSCGCLPGTLLGIRETLGLSLEEITKAMLSAGLVGVFISEQATFAAEVAGCQVECGAGSAMAAAGIVSLMNGTVEQCLDAASMALQNISGLVCDPVANRVEVPCLGKNVMAGSNALSSATMALAGFDKVIPLDEAIMAIYDIGSKLPIEFRCTFGGLGKTKTSLDIRSKLKQ